ncbi:hypothetical protein [Nitrospina watsonii]|uniref:Uncharacterized protein n=1 Tax=Nitrospina watsonii TaxID=1323948 RepID=A0ABM9HEV7_9BACT|nr:hypothetical protein [Nitrospina watsonii]CAI2718769.1 conserved membrane protein of unknown function [Nitrospina watsonii]
MNQPENQNTLWAMLANQPGWSAMLILIAMMALYMSRKPVHAGLQRLVATVYSGFRLASRALFTAEKRLCDRNKEVLLELGQDHMERKIEREFFRVNSVVERDLARYPELQKVIADQITQIEEDYKQCGQEVPPTPEWIEAVEVVAKLKVDHKNNPLTANILKSIHEASEKHHREVVREYRDSVAKRHALLQTLRPYWRKLVNSVDEVGKTLRGLLDRARDIDQHMDRYIEIINKTDKAERTLRASAAVQFAVSLLVVLIATGGAIINFNLIALPMSEMVGSTAQIGGMKVSDIAALVIIFVEMSMGLFLMEALRFTRLFPVIGTMDDRLRIRMIWVTFGILFTLACVEAALAFMRDQIAMDLSALRHSLTAGGGELEAVPVSGVNSWIPMLGQMVLGFILPFALTFVAIPLETLMHSCRSVFGDLLALAIRSLAVLFRILGSGFKNLGLMVTHVYDIIIFLPLWLEQMVKTRHKASGEVGSDNPPAAKILMDSETHIEQVAK